jgi:hypothetical protein
MESLNILTVGWLIQSALRRQAELSKVSIDAAAALSVRVNQLLERSNDAARFRRLLVENLDG